MKAPDANWDDVDGDLRDAVVLASMELRKTFYVSSGKRDDPGSAHDYGGAVDVSRINGTRFEDMNGTTARLLGNQVGATIVNFLPSGRGRELYTPGMAVRPDRFLSLASRKRLMASHFNHVHASVLP